MRRDLDRVLCALLGVVAVQVALGVAAHTPGLIGLAEGDLSAGNLLAAAAVVWLLVVVVAARTGLRLVRSLRARLVDLTLASNDWYWESDTDLVVTYSSEGVRSLLGYQPEELLGRSLFDFVAADRLTEAHTIVARARADGSGWPDTPMPWRHADGFPVALVGNAVPVVEHGELVGFRGWRRAAAGGSEQLARLAEVRSQLGALLRERDLIVALQPITLLRSQCPVGFEALARFTDGRSPDAWFGDAGRAGLRIELELLALTEALPLLEREVDPGLYLSVNASPELILDPRFAEALASVDASRVVVEITEHAVVARYDELRRALEPLRRRGLRLGVDDAGAGYASFAHVLQLRPDIIKIDRSVVARTPYDAAARALVVAIARLATEMDATVVAEGIEDQRELATVTVLDVDCGQGYHLGRPSTQAEQWRAWQQLGTLASASVVRPA